MACNFITLFLCSIHLKKIFKAQIFSHAYQSLRTIGPIITAIRCVVMCKINIKCTVSHISLFKISVELLCVPTAIRDIECLVNNIGLSGPLRSMQ